MTTSVQPSNPVGTLIRCAFLIGIGIMTEVVADFFRCFAAGFHRGIIHVDLWGVITVLVPVVAFMIGVMYAITRFTEVLIDAKSERVLLVGTFVASVILSGYFVPSICAH